jgi:aspartyl-tRNA(Asn)/glutamyl-tRNA(Gln) amidotransferase subunit A
MSYAPPSKMLAFLPASVLAREIATRRVSPIDVVDEFLERIAQYNGRLNAFASVYEEDARLAARAADTAIRAGHVLGPYHGVPIALKDLIEIEGRITTGGSAHFLNRQSTVTATLVRQLLAQGMIVLGKTQTVEFAFSGWGLNQHLGTPWNPWDLLRARTPGGSSSGSGVAVAGGLAPWAIGTDTGGSVRLPASFCGVTGLKPTIGRMSTHGILPLSNTFDTPGILGRNVLDTTLLFKVLQGPDPLDVNTRGVVPVDPLPTLKRGVIGLRLARMPAAEHEGVDSEVLAAYASALDCLAKAGALIVDVKLPFRFTDCFAAHMTTVQAEAYAAYGELVDNEATLLDVSVRKGIRASIIPSLRNRKFRHEDAGV